MIIFFSLKIYGRRYLSVNDFPLLNIFYCIFVLYKRKTKPILVLKREDEGIVLIGIHEKSHDMNSSVMTAIFSCYLS